MRFCKLFIFFIIIILSFSATAEEDDGGLLRLKLTKVKLLEQTRQADKAFAIIKKLKQQYPDNADILSHEADLYIKSGYYRNALSSIDQAITKAPEDENLKKQKEFILLTNAPYTSASSDIIMAGGASIEQKNTFKSHIKYKEFSSLGIEIQNNHFKVKEAVKPSGDIQRMSGNKQKGEIYFTHDYKNGNNYKISLYAGEDTIGAGARYTWRDKMGATDVELFLQKPDWDYIQGLTYKGVKDRLSISRTHRIVAGTKAKIDIAANRYGLDSDHNVANSVSTALNINYSLPTYNFMQKFFGNNLFVGVDYNIDGEYTLDKDKRIGPSGAEFFPIPIASREIHTFNFFIDKEFSFKTRIQVFGGYSLDRLGDEGPSYGSSVIYKPRDNIELELRASRNISTKKSTSSDNTLDQIGINLKWLF